MAKKGGQQQLQADIQTDEELERFMERPGLLVLDVYSEWCGPCQGMVGSLRKIKLDVGGDNLHLAICKSDTITALKRFNKRSEPIWLFVTGGRAVNLLFGSDVPKLVGLLMKELEKTTQKASRPGTYRLDELQPIEVEQQRIKMEAIERAERAEREIKHKKQIDYLTHVTDSIMENMPDIGVTVFGPQVNRDMFKKLTEPAEALKMQCKDRRVIQVSSDQFETVNFACKNPMPPDVIEQLDGKELLMCFWKIDESIGTVPNVLMAYAHELTKERVAPPNDDIPEEHVIPPLITTMKLKVEVELKEGETWVEEISSEEEARLHQAKSKAKTKSISHEEAHLAEEEAADLDAEEEASEEETVMPEPGGDAMGGIPSMPGFELEVDPVDEAGEDEEEVQEIKEEEPPKPLTRTKTVKMPPIWVPNSRRTHAALIYVFFRGQTSGFLPPDPKPEPPHVIMAFDASKRKEIMHVIDRHKDDVPLYGFFSSAEPDEAELIATSTDKYESSPHAASDKIVLKVNKVQSNMMLSLVSYGPSYVSPNVTVGKDEALKFFPEDYKPQEEVVVEVEKKKKKSKRATEINQEVEAAAAAAAAAAAHPPEAPAPVEGEAPAAEAPAAVEGDAAPAAGEAPPAGDAAPVAPPAEPAAEGAAPEAPAPAPAPEAPAAEEAPHEAPKEEAPAAEAPPEPEAEASAPAEPAPEPAAE
ncbi:fibrous sheath CABYR-binding protein [Drosophila simulans]|uniref:fibrous sheath CABYR-binding protein n=1 Tax=Drosophila simulans TaxID=7240 RepID=UPI00192D08F0|nr:fibrous sheath CABYR-binding protein [Drosophila simulans]